MDKLKAPKFRRAAVPTKLAPFVQAVQQALLADARRPKKERRTARALYAHIAVAGYEWGYRRALVDSVPTNRLDEDLDGGLVFKA